MPVHVVAYGGTPFGKRPESLPELCEAAGRGALELAGRKTIDLLVVGSMTAGSLGGTENLVSQVAERLQLDNASGFRVEAASATGAAAFHAAVGLVQSMEYRRALVVAGEKMTHRSTAETTDVLARSLSPSEQAVGATMPALAALVTQMYVDRFRPDPQAFDEVTVQARSASVKNPNAQFRSAVTHADVQSSRYISTPLRLLHCAAISDGAAAVVVERGSGVATVRGLGQALDAPALADRTQLASFAATRRAAARAFGVAHTTVSQVGLFEIHDAFAPFALINLEDVGGCPAGEAASWFLEGRTRPDGATPVNPSGGLLGRGHPVGVSGLVQIVEAVRQLRGEAGSMSLSRRPHLALAQSIGGLAAHNFVTLIGGGV